MLEEVPSTPFRFAISATFTAEPLQPAIEFWGRRLNADFEVRFAPYNQPQQTLLDPASVFAGNHHGMNVLLIRLEDLGRNERIADDLKELVHVTRDAATRLSAPLVVCVCPSSPAFAAGAARSYRELVALAAGVLEDVPAVQFVSPEQVDRLYPVEVRHDPDAERLAQIPYTETYYAALATSLVRHAHSLFTSPFKVIALDCDNTLWQGICGEDGPSGVVLDPARRALQEFMLDQRESGTLLAMASKNNEQDVLDTFAANPHMPLQLRHFVAWRLNWESKADNLVEIASELSLGVDSFILVDDNPKECAEVSGRLPEVAAIPLPENIALTPDFLKHVWAFDRASVTEEDRNRNAYYSQAQEFGREVRAATNLHDFVAGLNLKVEITPLTPEHVARVSQLTQRTNQFNFTSIRRSESQIQALVRDDVYYCATAEVSDRFGSYGLVGVLIFRVGATALEVDTFLLSCRVLGRGVEHRMLAWLAEEALRRGLQLVDVELVLTSKNRPAQQFLHAVGHNVETEQPEGFLYTFQASGLRDLRWSPATSVDAPKPSAKPSGTPGRRLVDYADIATNLATPAQVLEAMRRESQASHDTASTHQLTETEKQLAAIWSDLLKTPVIAPADNFFDLGGHSLLAVLLILRVRETFGVELPIDDVYSASLTMGELARKIETYQLSQMNPEEYEALLAEIEGLSDEEVQALLSKEDPGVL